MHTMSACSAACHSGEARSARAWHRMELRMGGRADEMQGERISGRLTFSSRRVHATAPRLDCCTASKWHAHTLMADSSEGTARRAADEEKNHLRFMSPKKSRECLR